MTETRAFVCFIIVFCVALTGCAKNEAPALSETRVLLDTFCTLTIYGSADDAMLEEAFELCARYEELLSISLEGSDVRRVNHAGGDAAQVDPGTAELLRAGLGFGEYSGGLFDVTVGRLSSLWDFSGDPRVPSGSELAAALATVGFDRVEVNGNTVRLADPGAWIDLGGIAKGYIADRLADFLAERGVVGAVIDLGGDVALVGAKPDGSQWAIGIREPFGGPGELLGVVGTGEAAIVTSGVYERMFIEGGERYHHILDPATGMPVSTDIVSATVLAESAVAGDALSTIAVLAGSGSAPGLLAGAPEFIGALLVLDSGEIVQLGEIEFRQFGDH